MFLTSFGNERVIMLQNRRADITKGLQKYNQLVTSSCKLNDFNILIVTDTKH